MNRSDEIKQLAVALVKAQSIMKTAKKDSENPFFKSTYADLASVWDAIRIPFTANGFAISQFAETQEDKIHVTTLLLHESGEWLSSELSLPALKYDKDKNPLPLDPQAIGSAITYARRYALASICGVASDDDDAEAAMDRKTADKPPIQPPQAKSKTEGANIETHHSATVESINKKSGKKKDGTAWTLYLIMASGNLYSTFSLSDAEEAKKAMTTGSPVEIAFVQTEKGRNIETIKMVEIPPTEGCTENPNSCDNSKFDGLGKAYCGQDEQECKFQISDDTEGDLL